MEEKQQQQQQQQKGRFSLPPPPSQILSQAPTRWPPPLCASTTMTLKHKPLLHTAASLESAAVLEAPEREGSLRPSHRSTGAVGTLVRRCCVEVSPLESAASAAQHRGLLSGEPLYAGQLHEGDTSSCLVSTRGVSGAPSASTLYQSGGSSSSSAGPEHLEESPRQLQSSQGVVLMTTKLHDDDKCRPCCFAAEVSLADRLRESACVELMENCSPSLSVAPGFRGSFACPAVASPRQAQIAKLSRAAAAAPGFLLPSSLLDTLCACDCHASGRSCEAGQCGVLVDLRSPLGSSLSQPSTGSPGSLEQLGLLSPVGLPCAQNFMVSPSRYCSHVPASSLPAPARSEACSGQTAQLAQALSSGFSSLAVARRRCHDWYDNLLPLGGCSEGVTCKASHIQQTKGTTPRAAHDLTAEHQQRQQQQQFFPWPTPASAPNSRGSSSSRSPSPSRLAEPIAESPLSNGSEPRSRSTATFSVPGASVEPNASLSNHLRQAACADSPTVPGILAFERCGPQMAENTGSAPFSSSTNAAALAASSEAPPTPPWVEQERAECHATGQQQVASLSSLVEQAELRAERERLLWFEQRRWREEQRRYSRNVEESAKGSASAPGSATGNRRGAPTRTRSALAHKLELLADACVELGLHEYMPNGADFALRDASPREHLGWASCPEPPLARRGGPLPLSEDLSAPPRRLRSTLPTKRQLQGQPRGPSSKLWDKLHGHRTGISSPCMPPMGQARHTANAELSSDDASCDADSWCVIDAQRGLAATAGKSYGNDSATLPQQAPGASDVEDVRLAGGLGWHDRGQGATKEAPEEPSPSSVGSRAMVLEPEAETEGPVSSRSPTHANSTNLEKLREARWSRRSLTEPGGEEEKGATRGIELDVQSSEEKIASEDPASRGGRSDAEFQEASVHVAPKPSRVSSDSDLTVSSDSDLTLLVGPSTSMPQRVPNVDRGKGAIVTFSSELIYMF